MHPVIEMAMRMPMTEAVAPIIETTNYSTRSPYLLQTTNSGDPSSQMKMMDAEQAAHVIAAQLRRQGVVCTFPRRARRNNESSVANTVVWTLQCDEASYRVRLIPHIGARITPIGEHLREPPVEE